MNLRHLSLAGLIGLALSLPAQALADDDASRVNFSGFGTVGAIHNHGSGAQFIRDITQVKGSANNGLSWDVDSRFGVQANYSVNEEIEAVAQVVSRYRWDNTFTPELTWGFLKYAPHEAIGLRAGRIGFDAFLAADSRDVGFSYLWVRPPVEYYGVLPFHYLDGVDVVLSTALGRGTGRLKAYTGIARQKVPTAGVLEDLAGSRVTGGFLDYQDTHWTARVGITDLRVLREFPTFALPDSSFDILASIRTFAGLQTDPAVASDLYRLARDTSLAGKHVTFKSVALAYEDGPLQAQLALSRFTPESLVFPHSHSGYLSVGYRLGQFTPYGAFAMAKNRKINRAADLAGRGAGLDPILGIVNYMFTAGERNQRTYTLGVRYDMADNVALKLQVDMIRNRTCSPLSLPIVGSTPPCANPILWPSVPRDWDGRAEVFSLALDFIF